MNNQKEKATIRVLHPFQGWCVDARGLHKHFSFFNFIDAFKTRNRYNSMTCLIFCPQCDNELCGSNSYKFFRVSDKGNTEHYQCSCCGTESKWDFDSFPAPVLVTPY